MAYKITKAEAPLADSIWLSGRKRVEDGWAWPVMATLDAATQIEAGCPVFLTDAKDGVMLCVPTPVPRGPSAGKDAWRIATATCRAGTSATRVRAITREFLTAARALGPLVWGEGTPAYLSTTIANVLNTATGTATLDKQEYSDKIGAAVTVRLWAWGA